MQIPRELGELIADGPVIMPSYDGDPLPILLERRWLIPYAKGQWVYGPQLTLLFKALKTLIYTRISKPLGFLEWILPRLLTIDTIKRFGTLDYAPEMVFKVSSVEQSGFCFMDPVQSASFYQGLSVAPIDDKDLPIKIFECMGGWLHRNEPSTELFGFSKVFEYLKLEHVYVGSPDQVLEIRQTLKERYATLFSELGLRWRLVVGPPCHASPGKMEKYKRAESLSRIPLYDFEFLIPYSGTWLEVCGACIEEDENISNYGIKTTGQNTLWSGCSGLGLNRLCWVVISQMGLDFSSYPETLKAHMEDS